MTTWESEIIADKESRDNALYKNARRDRKKWMPDEPNKWECPACKVTNIMRLHLTATGRTIESGFYFDDMWHDDEEPYDALLVITPRIYPCHNHKCHMRRFYWRNNENELLARYLGKYEDLDPLDYTSEKDPWKYYGNLKRNFNPNQLQMF